MNKQQTQPIRVLHVLGTTNLGGAESRIMELYPSLPKQNKTKQNKKTYWQKFHSILLFSAPSVHPLLFPVQIRQ